MTATPVRLQLRRTRGFRLQALSLATNGLACVRVDRRTMWGNRWQIGVMSNMLGRPVATVQEAVDCYRALAWPEAHHRAWVRENLAGKNLACWCVAPFCECCGTTTPDDEIVRRRAADPRFLSCCPERKMLPGAPCHADVLLEIANG